VDLIQLITTVIFGSGGVIGGLSLLKARKAQKAGAPGDETLAQQTVPNWDALTAYYRQEIEDLRGDLKRELHSVRGQVEHLEKLRELDGVYIDALESHIWQGLPPPPPSRPVPTVRES
jgi:hypothetical protein